MFVVYFLAYNTQRTIQVTNSLSWGLAAEQIMSFIMLTYPVDTVIYLSNNPFGRKNNYELLTLDCLWIS